MIKRIGVIVALLLVLLALPGPALAQGPTLAATRPEVAAGQRISFVGTGFTPGERAATWATAPDQSVVGGDYANAKGDEGRIEFSFQVPSDAIGGRWSLTAFGSSSKTPIVATFEVQGRAADSSPQASVTPAIGAPGTKFAFAALGYHDKEKVSYWFTGPDSLIHGAFPEGDRADKNGRVDISWPSPSDALLGPWVLTIQGLDSGKVRAVPFEIR